MVVVVFLEVMGISFMPHLGHLPGLFLTTSGCILQVYFFVILVCWCLCVVVLTVCAKVAVEAPNKIAIATIIDFILFCFIVYKSFELIGNGYPGSQAHIAIIVS